MKRGILANRKFCIACLGVLAVFLVAVLAVFMINCIVVGTTGARISAFDEEPKEETDKYECIVVLGAGLRPDGTPSDMLRDRLDAAIHLYRNGMSGSIVLTGDRSGDDYDEVGSMFRYCVSAGVPEEVLICDEKGFSTFESIDHVVHLLGFRRFIVVTQKYHLYRALYIADRMDDVESVGIAADTHKYRGAWMRSLREYVARTKDFFKSNFST